MRNFPSDSFNMPPGVRTSHIPGNRPSDDWWDCPSCGEERISSEEHICPACRYNDLTFTTPKNDDEDQ